MRRRGVGFVSVATIVTLFSFVHCRNPTEVTLDLWTDVPCSQLQGVTVTVGRASNIDTSSPGKTTHDCDASGHIGTVVVTPSGANDQEIAIKVVGGKGQDAVSCTGPTYGPGCIVARRVLKFQPHSPLVLPIWLRALCQGVPCAPSETCVEGACRDATLLDPGACTNASACDENELPARDGGAMADTGVLDASDAGDTAGAAVQLVGDSRTGAAVDSTDYGAPKAYLFAATGTGTVTRLFVQLDASNRAAAEIGIYSSDPDPNYPNPVQLLGSGNVPAGTGWVSTTIPGVAVTAGKRYWIAIVSQTPGTPVSFNEDQGGPPTAGQHTGDPHPSLPQPWPVATALADHDILQICAYATTF